VYNGWFTSPIRITWTAVDAETPVTSTTCKDEIFDRDVASWEISCSAVSKGGTGFGSVQFKRDTSWPTISLLGPANPPANTYGWNNSAVSIPANATDAPAGVASTTPTLTNNTARFTTEGKAQKISATDYAGHTATFDPHVNIDLTPPRVMPRRQPDPNSYGWNRENVTAFYTCVDDLSGADPGTTVKVFSQDGVNQGWTLRCTDYAGNVTETTQNGINIDRVLPVVVRFFSSEPNGNGWYNKAVSLHVDCWDGASGVLPGTEHTDIPFNNEGRNQSGTWLCEDRAGNRESGPFTVSIDKTPPRYDTGRQPPPDANGWNREDVTGFIKCIDDLSGTLQATAIKRFSQDGANQSWTFRCFDQADNTTDATQSGFNIDKTPPVIVPTLSPTANANGWNNTAVSVRFQCTDALSGVVAPDRTDMPFTLEGARQSGSWSCTDVAGNLGNGSVTVNIDKTPPTITGRRVTLPNTNGWNNSDVFVTFQCADALSGLGTAPSTIDAVVTSEGANQSAVRSCSDLAGNPAQAAVSGISIDKQPPSISATRFPLPNINGWNNTIVTARFTCSDTLSGLAAGSPPPDVVFSTDGANQSATRFCFDLAGNSASAGVTSINIDQTPPFLVVPASVTLLADDPRGAPATYAGVSLTDNLDPAPVLVCVPAIGTWFPLGPKSSTLTTIATCTGTDRAGNTSGASFPVTVKGPSDQIVDLIADIARLAGSLPISDAIQAQLRMMLQSLIVSNPAAVCRGADVLIPAVRSQSGRGIPVATANDIIASLTRIKRVLACP
jgi:hypothetical protein